MQTRDLHSNIKVTQTIAPAAAKTANATTTGSTIAHVGYESVEHVAQSGVITDGTLTGHLYAGDASDMSDEAEVTDAKDLIGTVPVFAVSDDNVTKSVGYRGPKAYSRLKIVQAGATTGAFFVAFAIQGHARLAPTS
jgi:hypothetical protein